MSQLSSPKRKRDFEFFHIGFKCSRDCSTLVNLFSLGAVEVSFQRFSGVCSLHQGLIGGEVTGVEVSAKGVIGGGVGDSNPQADSSLSISWRDPNSDGGTHSQTHLNGNCHRETSKSSPSITISLAVSAESYIYLCVCVCVFL